LLGNGTINNDATVEYVTPRNVISGSTAGNGVLCGSLPIVTSCNHRGIAGSGVFCWVRSEAISQGPTGPIFSSERMLHKDYERKDSVEKIYGRESQGA
jgi:hypothetical protein